MRVFSQQFRGMHTPLIVPLLGILLGADGLGDRVERDTTGRLPSLCGCGRHDAVHLGQWRVRPSQAANIQDCNGGCGNYRRWQRRDHTGH